MTTDATCSICKRSYEGQGYNPLRKVIEGDCCSTCSNSVVIPLRMARLEAREGARLVAEFARLLARQRAMLAPRPIARIKDMALIAATGMVCNAVEASFAEAEGVDGE